VCRDARPETTRRNKNPPTRVPFSSAELSRSTKRAGPPTEAGRPKIAGTVRMERATVKDSDEVAGLAVAVNSVLEVCMLHLFLPIEKTV
jgi:hypothetical protein